MFDSARLPKLALAISSPRGMGSVVVAPFPVTLTMCVTVKANALTEEQVRGTDLQIQGGSSRFVPTPPLLWHSHST